MYANLTHHLFVVCEKSDSKPHSKPHLGGNRTRNALGVHFEATLVCTPILKVCVHAFHGCATDPKCTSMYAICHQSLMITR